MGRSNTIREKQPNVQCIEVLVSRSHIKAKDGNLFWTLSVYSLENKPVKQERSFHNSEVFHFMIYDWERTIEKLLSTHQVPYSIIQYFQLDSIYVDASVSERKSVETMSLESAATSYDQGASLRQRPLEEPALHD